MAKSEIEEIFLAEASRRLGEVESILRAAFPAPGSAGSSTLLRQAHSLKGTAGSLGHKEIEALAERIWTRLDEERRGRLAAGEIEREVRADFRAVRDEVERLRRRAANAVSSS